MKSNVAVSMLSNTDLDRWESVGLCCDPYLNAVYQRKVAELFDVKVLHIEHTGSAASYQVFLWVEAKFSRFSSILDSLRSLDWSVISLPAIYAHDDIEAGMDAFVEQLPFIGRKTGTGFVSFFKLREPHALMLRQKLQEKNIPYQLEVFNTRWRILLTDDIDDFYGSRSKKAWYNLRRSERLLTENHPGDLEYSRLLSTETGKTEFLQTAHLVLEYLQQLHDDDPEQVERLRIFYPEVISFWYDQQIAEICMYTINGIFVSAELNIYVGEELWVVLMVYNRDFDSYSPSMLLLKRQIEDSHRRGVRTIDLGGEGDAWKMRWAGASEATYGLKIASRRSTRLLWKLLGKHRDQVG